MTESMEIRGQTLEQASKKANDRLNIMKETCPDELSKIEKITAINKTEANLLTFKIEDGVPLIAISSMYSSSSQLFFDTVVSAPETASQVLYYCRTVTQGIPLQHSGDQYSNGANLLHFLKYKKEKNSKKKIHLVLSCQAYLCKKFGAMPEADPVAIIFEGKKGLAIPVSFNLQDNKEATILHIAFAEIDTSQDEVTWMFPYTPYQDQQPRLDVGCLLDECEGFKEMVSWGRNMFKMKKKRKQGADDPIEKEFVPNKKQRTERPCVIAQSSMFDVAMKNSTVKTKMFEKLLTSPEFDDGVFLMHWSIDLQDKKNLLKAMHLSDNDREHLWWRWQVSTNKNLNVAHRQASYAMPLQPFIAITGNSLLLQGGKPSGPNFDEHLEKKKGVLCIMSEKKCEIDMIPVPVRLNGAFLIVAENFNKGFEENKAAFQKRLLNQINREAVSSIAGPFSNILVFDCVHGDTLLLKGVSSKENGGKYTLGEKLNPSDIAKLAIVPEKRPLRVPASSMLPPSPIKLYDSITGDLLSSVAYDGNDGGLNLDALIDELVHLYRSREPGSERQRSCVEVEEIVTLMSLDDVEKTCDKLMQRQKNLTSMKNRALGLIKQWENVGDFVKEMKKVTGERVYQDLYRAFTSSMGCRDSLQCREKDLYQQQRKEDIKQAVEKNKQLKGADVLNSLIIDARNETTTLEPDDVNVTLLELHPLSMYNYIKCYKDKDVSLNVKKSLDFHDGVRKTNVTIIPVPMVGLKDSISCSDATYLCVDFSDDEQKSNLPIRKEGESEMTVALPNTVDSPNLFTLFCNKLWLNVQPPFYAYTNFKTLEDYKNYKFRHTSSERQEGEYDATMRISLRAAAFHILTQRQRDELKIKDQNSAALGGGLIFLLLDALEHLYIRPGAPLIENGQPTAMCLHARALVFDILSLMYSGTTFALDGAPHLIFGDEPVTTGLISVANAAKLAANLWKTGIENWQEAVQNVLSACAKSVNEIVKTTLQAETEKKREVGKCYKLRWSTFDGLTPSSHARALLDSVHFPEPMAEYLGNLLGEDARRSCLVWTSASFEQALKERLQKAVCGWADVLKVSFSALLDALPIRKTKIANDDNLEEIITPATSGSSRDKSKEKLLSRPVKSILGLVASMGLSETDFLEEKKIIASKVETKWKNATEKERNDWARRLATLEKMSMDFVNVHTFPLRPVTETTPETKKYDEAVTRAYVEYEKFNKHSPNLDFYRNAQKTLHNWDNVVLVKGEMDLKFQYSSEEEKLNEKIVDDVLKIVTKNKKVKQCIVSSYHMLHKLAATEQLNNLKGRDELLMDPPLLYPSTITERTDGGVEYDTKIEQLTMCSLRKIIDRFCYH